MSDKPKKKRDLESLMEGDEPISWSEAKRKAYPELFNFHPSDKTDKLDDLSDHSFLGISFYSFFGFQYPSGKTKKSIFRFSQNEETGDWDCFGKIFEGEEVIIHQEEKHLAFLMMRWLKRFSRLSVSHIIVEKSNFQELDWGDGELVKFEFTLTADNDPMTGETLQLIEV
jgi:hypothetical protein